MSDALVIVVRLSASARLGIWWSERVEAVAMWCLKRLEGKRAQYCHCCGADWQNNWRWKTSCPECSSCGSTGHGARHQITLNGGKRLYLAPAFHSSQVLKREEAFYSNLWRLTMNPHFSVGGLLHPIEHERFTLAFRWLLARITRKGGW
jgi:hypothetical protein